MPNSPSEATLRIRVARADDAQVAVPLIYASGPAAFDYVFARGNADACAFLHRAFVDGAGEFGYRNHAVGEHDGSVVAVGSGFTHAQAARFTVPAVRQIVRHFGWRASDPMVCGLRTERVIRPPRAVEFYLGHLGVAPRWRGCGFGTQLVEWLVQRGREQGCRCAVLDVADDNPRAQALYQRIGFRVTDERHCTLHNQHGAVPNQRRMQRDLRA